MKKHYKSLFFLLLYVLIQTINVTFYLVSSSFQSVCNKSLSGTSPCCNCFATFDVPFVKSPKRDLLALLIIQGDFVTEFSVLKGSLVDATATSTMGSKIIFLFSRCNFCNILLSTLESNNLFSLITLYFHYFFPSLQQFHVFIINACKSFFQLWCILVTLQKLFSIKFVEI